MSHSPITIGTVKPASIGTLKVFSPKFSIIIQGIIRFHNFHYNEKHPQSQSLTFQQNSVCFSFPLGFLWYNMDMIFNEISIYFIIDTNLSGLHYRNQTF